VRRINMDVVDDIKQARRAKMALLKKRSKEVQDQIDDLEEDNREVYVNGEAKELHEYCKVAKTKFKLKEIK